MKSCLKAIMIFFMLASSVASVIAEVGQGTERIPQDEMEKGIEGTEDDLISAATDYRASLEKLVALLERQVRYTARLVEKREQLYEQRAISGRELEESKQSLAEAQTRLDQTLKELAEAEALVAEVQAAGHLTEQPPLAGGGYRADAAIIRYKGDATWSLSAIWKVESFFSARFDRALPVSALGQTRTHDRLGFDHHDNVDVALHPDSPEGRALMTYLRDTGIPFIAFRQAIRGSATGAHIHIGRPSRRTGR